MLSFRGWQVEHVPNVSSQLKSGLSRRLGSVYGDNYVIDTGHVSFRGVAKLG